MEYFCSPRKDCALFENNTNDKKKKNHPPKTPQQLFCGHAERTFLISFPARILTTICTLNCLENTGE